MKRLSQIIASLVAIISFASFADELDIAKEALRDGLWDVARTHASRVEGDEAKQLILESYCREERWDDAFKSLKSWAVGDSLTFRYYNALLLFKTGCRDDALAILNATDFSSTPFSLLATRLRIELAIAKNDFAVATTLLKESQLATADIESRMLAADVFLAIGQKIDAEKIWREVAIATNATEKAFVIASVNLADENLLRDAYSRVKSVALRRFVGSRLGRVLLEDEKTFEEGSSLIRALAKDSPDAKGVRDSFVALCDSLLAKKQYLLATDSYREALEIWPKLAMDSQVNASRGWAFRALEKFDDAIEAFSRAEETATNDVAKANAILEQGDVMSEIGRGEDALAKYRIVLAKYPNTPAGEKLKVVVELRELEAKGRELFKNYDFVGAQKIFQDVASRDNARKSRMAYYEVLCLYGQGLDRDAASRARVLATNAVELAIRADSTLWLAKFSFNRRRWADAKKFFATYCELVPKSPVAPSALIWSARAAFAENNFEESIQIISRLAELYPGSKEKFRGYLIQGEALIALARFDEAVLILDRVIVANDEMLADEKNRAQILRADALFAMGADNPVRYRAALSAYQAIRQREELSPSLKISVAFKMSRTLEKLKRIDEAIDQYYSSVVLAYREGRQKGIRFDDEARTAFARAAFRLADEYESRGQDFQAMHILELVVASDVPVAKEAEKRIDRIQTKGRFL